MKTLEKPIDHHERMTRVTLSLTGLSVGDSFGQLFFRDPEQISLLMTTKQLPVSPWNFTDDTVMALSVSEILGRHGQILQHELATAFAHRYAADPWRGYGGMAHDILTAITGGSDWRSVSPKAFDGTGSMGNGGAMRAAPLGAYFADEIPKLIEQARLSAEVTHAHPEGQAGAIAVALAAAFAWNTREKLTESAGTELLAFVIRHTPRGETYDGIAKALGLPRDRPVQTATGLLGNGSRVISQDTVPFCLWCAARHLDNYVDAMWTTVSGLGDRDTTCAIVGGIVALSAGERSIPTEWLKAREPLNIGK